MRQLSADICEGGVIYLESGRVHNVMPLEDDTVVDGIKPSRSRDEILPRGSLVSEVGDKVFLMNHLIFEKADKNEAINHSLCDLRQRLAVEIGISIFESPGERVAALVEFFQEGVVNALIAAFEQASLRGLAAPAGKRFGELFQRTARHSLAGKEIEYFGELLLAGVIAVVVFAQDLIQRGVNVGLGAAVENLELLEIGEHGYGRLSIPTVADSLKAIVRRGDVAEGFLGLDKETNVAKIRRDVKGVIRPALRGAHADAAFYLHFLLKRILLPVVVHIPAQSDEELADEVGADFGFLIGRGKIVRFVGAEICDQFLHRGECFFKGWRFHGSAV
ncbi:MAG: hypothetical protein NTX50_03380 [Candidatus Sumerlaeota bacterium]|nr:hypothetical protein [Candidatus Sumerlaeota bacterium]